MPVDHLDLYRTDGGRTLELQGLLDPLNDMEAITIVEWAERLSWWGRLPTMEITFLMVDLETRRLTFHYHGDRGRLILGSPE